MLRMRTLTASALAIWLCFDSLVCQELRKMVLIGLFGIRLGLKRGPKRAVRAVEEAKNEAVNARKFLTEEAWPDVQKYLEEMRDTVTFAARMVVLLIALCVLYLHHS